MTRFENLRKLEADRELRGKALELCRRDPVFFIDEFWWSTDPRLLLAEDDQGNSYPAAVPVKLFDYQKRFIRWLEGRLEDREDGLVEKSRDTGFSVLAAGFAVWLWLFRRDAPIGFGSRKEKLVDNREDPKTLFEKVRFGIESLPPFLRPSGWKRKGEYDNYLRIINPVNGATITGEGGDNMGRGARTIMYFADEWAFVDNADAIDSALSMATDVCIFGSSVNGIGNNFYKKRHTGSIEVYIMDWRDDPRKSAAWRERLIETKGPTIVAREVDRDYTASVEGIMIPGKWVQAAVEFDPVEYGFAPYTGESRVAGLDIADGGVDDSVTTIRRGPFVERIESRSEGGANKVARWCARICQQERAGAMYYDASGGYGSGVSGELEERERDFTYSGVWFGTPASDAQWYEEDGAPVTAKDLFADHKAELWGIMRERIRKTFLVVSGELGNGDVTVEELLSIPNDSRLIAELSMPKQYEDKQGRVKVETKDQLKRRVGSDASPDFAESLSLTFADGLKDTPILIGRA